MSETATKPDSKTEAKVEPQAKQTKAASNDLALRERVALQIYIDKTKTSRRGFDPKVAAAEAFKQAKAFCEVAESFREMGEEAIKQALPEDDGLDYASAPNLPKSHPFNAMSRRFGTVQTASQMRQLRESNPEEYRRLCNAVGAAN